MTSPIDRQTFPAAVPTLVGQQFIQSVHVSVSVTASSPTVSATRHIGYRTTGAVSVSSPTTGATRHIGYRTSGSAALSSPNSTPLGLIGRRLTGESATPVSPPTTAATSRVRIMEHPSVSMSVSVSSPSRTQVVRPRVMPSLSQSVSRPTAVAVVRAQINPNQHLRETVTASSPTAVETRRIGFTVRDGCAARVPVAHNDRSHREHTVLTTPSQTHDFRFDGKSGLWGYWLDAMSLARVDGEWQAVYVAVPEEVPGLDKFYRGGHRHYISPDEAEELRAAGFSDYIRTEVSK